jgi:YD repeat-containing protein
MWVNGVATPTQAPTLMFYDGDHQVTLTVEPSGVAQAQWYDAVGNVTQSQSGAWANSRYTSSQAVAQTFYDSDNQATLTVDRAQSGRQRDSIFSDSTAARHQWKKPTQKLKI